MSSLKLLIQHYNEIILQCMQTHKQNVHRVFYSTYSSPIHPRLIKHAHFEMRLSSYVVTSQLWHDDSVRCDLIQVFTSLLLAIPCGPKSQCLSQLARHRLLVACEGLRWQATFLWVCNSVTIRYRNIFAIHHLPCGVHLEIHGTTLAMLLVAI